MRPRIRSVLLPAFVGAFRIVDRLRRTPHRYVLILSHMRSGSSLLLHLLMTSPEISGCGERNTAYRDETDLVILALKSKLGLRSRLGATYTVDQLNHTQFLPSEDLLAHPSVMPIILFREPLGTLSSMMETLATNYSFELADGVDHYRERIAKLTRYAKLLDSHGRFMALTYNELLEDTGKTLLRLEAYLGLRSSLAQKYATYYFTGRQGDPSKRIKAGYVLPPRVEFPVDVDATILDELGRLFDECYRETRCSRG